MNVKDNSHTGGTTHGETISKTLSKTFFSARVGQNYCIYVRL